MAKHQQDSNAGELWNYFNSVIEWVKTVFPTYSSNMKDVEWGLLYNEFGTQYADVTSKKGIYEYILSGREKVLSIRTFTNSQKLKAYTNQNGICPYCNNHYEFNEMDGDHIIPWSKGGKIIDSNLQMLCRKCNNSKSVK